MAEFVHLHLHSEYSLLDGAARISEIPKYAASLGHTAVAITDHGVMYGAVAFYKACKAEGIHPIIGCEVYVAPKSRFDKNSRQDVGYHLVLLCKNELGYRNLCKLVSDAFIDGFYSKPRIDKELLRANAGGLIALSACFAGEIPTHIMSGNMGAAINSALEYASIFEENSFYLELQHHGLADDDTVCRGICEVAKHTGLPMVATNDVHYLRAEDAATQAVLLAIQTNHSLTEGRPFGFATDEFYYKSTEQMQALFPDLPEAIENTAEMCQFNFTFGKTYLPTFPEIPGVTHKETLERYARQGLRDRINRGAIQIGEFSEKEYEDRLEYELSVIDSMGFNAYYLIVQDFIAFAKKKGIPVGPGRGSGAGSLVAFCVGITDIDPLRYHLLFERFLNPERVSLPDFDVDFCYVRRDEVIEYVRQRYGEDHVSQIITFGTLAARAAVRDVGRAMGMPYADVDKVARLIPQKIGVTIADALKHKELRELYASSDEIKRLIDTAASLEGMPRNASTHAAGVVITEKRVADYVPLSVNNGVVVTQFDMTTVADLGLVKFDFLGLRYLTIIDDAEREAKESDPKFSLSQIPFDDPETFHLISEGKTGGVFQLESEGMRQMLTQLRPSSLEDVIAAIALYRPGPMDSIPSYIARKFGKEPIVYDTPELESILSLTNGCIIYQEQVMQIFQKLAGYSFARADIVRRAMAKKKADVMEAERGCFANGAAKRGIARDVADRIFDSMVSFASYAFNKSHAAAYACITYKTAYLNAHKPAAYFSALLTSVLNNTAKIGEYISECTRLGIQVLPPSINHSKMNFSVVNGQIRFGMLALRNVGRQFIAQILAERQRGGLFKSFEDFLERMAGGDLNKRQVEALIKSGCFDGLGVFRSQLLASYESMIDSILQKQRGNVTGQLDIFAVAENTDLTDGKSFDYPSIDEFSIRELLMLEKESSGMYFSGHMLDDYSEHVCRISHTPIADILEDYNRETGEFRAEFQEKQRVTVVGMITAKTNKRIKSGDDMAFLTLEDRYAELEVIVFPKSLERYAAVLRTDVAVAVVGTLSGREDEPPKLLLSSVTLLQSNGIRKEAEIEKPKRLYLRVSSLDSPASKRAINELKRSREGTTEVVLYDISTKKYVRATELLADLSSNLPLRLESILGKENVIIQ